jgi:hypothetical protein
MPDLGPPIPPLGLFCDEFRAVYGAAISFEEIANHWNQLREEQQTEYAHRARAINQAAHTESPLQNPSLSISHLSDNSKSHPSLPRFHTTSLALSTLVGPGNAILIEILLAAERLSRLATEAVQLGVEIESRDVSLSWNLVRY